GDGTDSDTVEDGVRLVAGSAEDAARQDRGCGQDSGAAEKCSPGRSVVDGVLRQVPLLCPVAAFATRSKRSRFITLFHAATKSRTNICCESAHAYASTMARSCEFEPKTRSTAVPVHLTLPVRRSQPSYTFSADADTVHSVFMSSRFTKKSLVNVSGWSVRMPWLAGP